MTENLLEDTMPLLDQEKGVYNDSLYTENYLPNITLKHCSKLYQNETLKLLKSHPNGFCDVSFDKILCWPPTPFNTTAEIKCFSEFLGIRYDDTKNATRDCLWNGSWSKSMYDDCTEVEIYPTSVEIQSNIYLVGYIISSITLAVAIFIFTYFKELRCLRNKIHMNLLWSYLLTYCMWIIILIELNFREHMAVTCVAVVTLLHYFHITTFFWMFVEGLYLYILVVRTLTRDSFKLRVYVLIGWGTPLIFIIIWTIFKTLLIENHHDQHDACNWFSASNIDYIFQAPTLIVLVINIIFMISIMIVLVTKLRSANTLEIQQYRKAVKALAVLIPLLGVTYAITIYAPLLSIWDMIRSALLSVQGFMVALFYCFLNTEVQNTLKHHFKNWRTEKSLGPSRLRSSSRSKDWSPRSRTESLRNTEWTLIGAEDVDDCEKKTSHSSLHHVHHSKGREGSNNITINQKRELLNNNNHHQPSLLINNNNNNNQLIPRRLISSTETTDFNQPSISNNNKVDDLNLINKPIRDLFNSRKELLINQTLIEQNEDSLCDLEQNSLNNDGKRDVLVKQNGQSIIVPTASIISHY